MSLLLVSLGLLLLLASYAVVDAAIRGSLLARIMPSSFLMTTFGTVLLTLGCCGLGAAWQWGDTPAVLRYLSAFLGLILAWNASTRDIDPVAPRPLLLARALLPLLALLTYWTPAALLALLMLLSRVFSFWLHHATFVMRLAQALLAYACAQPLVSGVLRQSLPLNDSLLLLLIIMQTSHYFITAIAKMWLGPHWFSWPQDNQLHHLAASAYSWGWARFVPWRRFTVWLRAIRALERPVQWSAFLLELFAPLACCDLRLAAVFSLAFATFHSGVCAVAGLLFWDWIAADLALAYVYFASPAIALPWYSLLTLTLLVMAIFPLRHKLWKPMPLGWYDTPLTARIHWEGIAESGNVYGIYNDFMCPHERLYGRVNGCFFVPHPVLTYHLGEAWKPELVRLISAAGPSLQALEPLRARYGIHPQADELRQRHLRYLQAFFAQLNRGARKSVLPPALRWLKAPGDQLFYWGALPPYARQERLRSVRLRFVEQYFDGTDLVTLSDQVVGEVDIPDEPPSDALVEPPPKALDNYLLQLAAGRLLDLPGMKKNYTEVLAEM